MQCFAALADLLHFSRAAERMNMTQPAFSRQIIALEEALDVKLVARNSHNVNLTAAGEVFLTGCRDVFELLDNTSRRATLIERGFEGSISIGYTDFAISANLPTLLYEFRREYPNIILEPFQGSTRELLIGLEEERLDMVFATGPVERDGLSAVPFTQNGLLLVLNEGHPLASRANIKLADLVDEDFVFGVPRLWRFYLRHIERIFSEAGIEPNIVERGFNSEGLFGLVAGRMGITIYPDCVRNYHRRGLVLREVHDLTAKVPTMAVWRETDESPTLANFKAFLETDLASRREVENA